MILSLIAALANNHVIGKNNQLPWHLPADLQHFKNLTLNKSIIMGRKTFESIGRALPQRRNIVISRQADYSADGIEVFADIESALAALAREPELMLIGGAELYQQMITHADRLYLTLVDTIVEGGDAYFPSWDPVEWVVIHEKKCLADEKNNFNYTFITLSRI